MTRSLPLVAWADGLAARLPVLGARWLHIPALMRRSAVRARRAGDRPRDAYYRRQACRAAPGDPGAWLQYGHALKEIGCFDRARDAYARAADLAPGDGAAPFELAYLAKIAGDFPEAARRFEAARQAGHPAAAQIDTELALLARIDNSVIFPERVGPVDPRAVHVFLSAPEGASMDGPGGDLSALGRADYSYGFAMRGFRQALEALGVAHSTIRNPEAVTDIRERSNAGRNIHLAFYPPERMRLLKGAYNIACFAWEFDRLRARGEAMSYHAFGDQTTMLGIVDEIWVPSEHGAQAVAASVDRPVSAVASPILADLRAAGRAARPSRLAVNAVAAKLVQPEWQPLAILQRMQGIMHAGSEARKTTLPALLRRLPDDVAPTFYLTVLNVHDFRKQLKPMLDAFAEFARRGKENYLLIKLTSPRRGTARVNDFVLGEQIADAGELALPLVSGNILICDQNLTREELNALYDVSGFYLCTSFAEGQNLPILEAMGRGVVPVSVDHTAMRQYVDDATGVPIRSHRREFDPRLSQRYGMSGLDTNFVDAADVRDALARATALDDAGYAARSAAGIALVKRDFGVEPVRTALAAVVARLDRTAAAA